MRPAPTTPCGRFLEVTQNPQAGEAHPRPAARTFRRPRRNGRLGLPLAASLVANAALLGGLGYVTFAKSGKPNSRTTQLFINYGDNARLDADGFTPFGRVIEGMEIVDKINSKYRERPDQGAVQAEGNAYLKQEFPDLDFIKKATIVEAKN